MAANSPHLPPHEAPAQPPARLAWLGLPARELALVAAVVATLAAAITGFGLMSLSQAAAPSPQPLPPASTAAWSTTAPPEAPETSPSPRTSPTGHRVAQQPLIHLISTPQELSP